MRRHGDGDLVEAMQNTLSKNTSATGTLVWTSPDLLTVYSIQHPSTTPTKRAPSTPQARLTAVTRERCVAIPEKP